MGPDPELGIRQLYALFRERLLQPPEELALLEARLRQNSQDRRMFGDYSANCAELNQIMYGLILIAQEEFGVNFNDLCRPRPVQHVSTPLITPKPKGNVNVDEPWSAPDYALRKNWAVFVGANTYEDQMNYPSLQVCVADATALARQFAANGFSTERMQVIVDAAAHNRPTRGNILNTLQTTAAMTRSDDFLLFYYSGHGDSDENDSYLIASDGWAGSLQNTAVPFSIVKQIMQGALARSKVIILDACHMGVQLGSKGSKRMSPRFMRHVFEQAEGFVVLFSCAKNQISYQSSTQGQSVYTYFLLQALQGQADMEARGRVTVHDINNYVTDKVNAWATQQKCLQSPTISTEMRGEIVVCEYLPSVDNV